MNMAIFGGSFDPVHNGHLFVAQKVLEMTEYSHIIFAPSWRSPLSDEAPYALPEERYEMLRLALRNQSGQTIDRRLLDRPEQSYTIDLIERYYHREGEECVGLIIGDDLIESLNLWKRVEDLLSMVVLIIARRTNNLPSLQSNDSIADIAKEKKARIVSIDNETMSISSSHIRERRARRQPIDSLVPSEVDRYILERHLYE